MRRDELSLPDPPTNDRPFDRWSCGRAGDDLPCSHGPSRHGTCPLADACRPKRNWHGRRKRFGTVAIAAIVFLLALLSQPDWRADVFKPGELTTAHAQILAATGISDRCASCHPQAATSMSSWFSKDAAGHTNVSQTDRCLNCHHRTIDRPTATLAHNLPRLTRKTIRLASLGSTDKSWHDRLPSPSIDQEQIQCNACHREHGGAESDLSAVSDQQCQTCHADRFGSFATSHPDWDRWPYGRGRRIAFNHASHAHKHFPATKQGDGVALFQCSDCHHKTSNNELTRVTTFERGCKSCHQVGLEVQVADGIDLFALPTLTADSANRVGRWPAQATGFYDGRLGAITELLLRSDKETELSIRDIPESDFGRIDPSDIRSVEAAERIAKEYQVLLEQVASDGQIAIADRITAAGITRSSAGSFVQSLPTQLIARAANQWFNGGVEGGSLDLSSLDLSSLDGAGTYSFAAPVAAKPSDDLLGGDDDDLLDSKDDLLLGADPLAADLLFVEPLAETELKFSSGFDAQRMLPEGGWYRDDLRMAIRYRGGRHADPVLKSAIDIISQLPTTDPVHQRLLKNPSVAACVSCHPGAVTSTNGWKSQPMIGQKREFTKFAHGPHLNIANLADCTHCHKVGLPPASSGNISQLSLTSGFIDPHDFSPMTRQACADCHTPQAAGDACIKCHRYHIDMR